MPPVLKILSLVTTVLCVVLFFGTFSLDDHITYTGRYPSVTFKPSVNRKNLHATSSVVTESTTTEITPSVKNLSVIELTSAGTYFGYVSTSSNFIDFSSLERIGGNYYKGPDGIYYLSQPPSACGEFSENKLTKLAFSKPSLVTTAQRGNFVTDKQDVFVLFLKLVGVDPATFSYVGIAAHEGSGVEEVRTYWYKDKYKIVTLVSAFDGCNGSEFREVENTYSKEIDPATFEYIGSPREDVHISYAKDKNYFYNRNGRISEVVTPQNCVGDFFKECFPRIYNASTSSTTQQ